MDVLYITLNTMYKLKCNSVSDYMSSTDILTPQEICQLDTFTLEEKIQQLQALPNPQLYAQILKIAKLQLIDRLQIEQFGLKLANDQYKIDFDIKLPPIQQQKQIQRLNPLSSQVRKKDIMSKIVQASTNSAVCFLTIGKPAVNPRYKPKVKKLQPALPSAKNFLKAKSQTQVISKSTAKTMKKLPPTAQCIKVEAQEKLVAKEQKKQKQVKQQFNLKQKLKKEVKQMNVPFIQNDVYEELKVILPMQKLVQVQNCQIIHQNQSILTQIEVQKVQRQIQQQRINTQIQEQKIQQKIQSLQSNQQQKQSETQTKKMQPSFNPQQFSHNFAKEQLQTPKIQKKQAVSVTTFDYESKNMSIQQNIKQSVSPKSIERTKYHQAHATEIYVQIPKQPKIDKNIQNSGQKSKEFRSVSMRNLPKKATKQPFDFVEIPSIKIEASKPKQKQLKGINTHYGSFRQMAKPVFPYHQIIPSFQKLFPHCKNLLTTLRNVQDNLRQHFSKNVDQKSIQNDYLRINSDDLTFRVVSESQRARKHRSLFGIQINSFMQRGQMMLQRMNQKDKIQGGLFYRVVRTKEEVYDIVNCSFHRTKEWLQLPHGLQLKSSWNLLWTWSRPQIDFTDLLYFQKVNHFIGNKQIARKDLLKKNIQKIQKLGPKMKQLFDFIPETFLLPGENIAFIKKYRQHSIKDKLNYWILKPVGMSRGRGIQLISKLQDIVFSEPVVLQKYLSYPLLIDNYKFDMRIYVLVTSINPLQAFIYRQGFARLSTQQYSLDQQDLQNKFIHLTNFAVQKDNVKSKPANLQQQLGGCKISLKMLQNKLGCQKWQVIYRQIQEIVIKSLVACMNNIPQNTNCFQLFGYDIIIDQNMKCWLLQVNSSPSLQKQYPLDQIIKQQLVDDCLEIVGPVKYDRERLLEVVQRRRKEAEGLKSSINTHNNSYQQLDQDLDYVLHGKPLRKYGEIPNHQNFQMIAPSEKYHQIVKQVQQYKIDPIIKEQ